MASAGDVAQVHTALTLSWYFSTPINDIAFIIRRDVVTRERAEYFKVVRHLSFISLTRWSYKFLCCKL
jgi:hypothetical protein